MVSDSNTSEQRKEFEERIDRKIREVELYFLLSHPPLPSKLKNLDIIKQLLKEYGSTNQKEIKFKIAVKLAQLLEHEKDFKKAVGLYLHLENHDTVLRTLAAIAEAKDCKKADAYEWYKDFASEYREKKRYTYFEHCIEKAKNYAEELEQFVELEERLVKGAEEMGKVPALDGQALLKSKLDYWKWSRLD
jgi:hypothetical protein